MLVNRMNDQAQGIKILGTVSTHMFPGDKLFELYATHGLPLDAAINRIMMIDNRRITWDKFIEQARKNNRWDFQILDMMENGLKDGCVDKNEIEGILQRAKLYMLQNPL